MAILRHKRETIAKQTYNESYRSSLSQVLLFDGTLNQTTEHYARLITEELTHLHELPTPAERMLQLEALCWWLVGYSTKKPLKELWCRIGDLSEMTLSLSLRWWQKINEYVSERIGSLLYLEPPEEAGFGQLPKREAVQSQLSH
jgi:hypothetical protein